VTGKVLRGRVLYFVSKPTGPEDLESYIHLEDGGIAIADDGTIAAVGPYVDVENAHKFALDRFVGELLPVLDSLELGLEAADTAGADSLREGMDLTLKKFQAVLEKFGVSVIEPHGEKFNPDRHEAVSMQELEGSESGTVISVMQKGYDLNGRLIRPAMVIVAK